MTSPGESTVLIVDDEPLYADAHARMLGDRYDVSTVYSGDAALEAIDENVDVLLIDRKMPQVSGDEVLEKLDRQGLECPRIMVTALDRDVEVVETSVDGYLTKPVSAGDLTECIERALEART